MRAILAPLGLLALAAPQALPAAAIDGLWKNPAGSVIIAIAPCGEAMCGRVEWASEEAKADARKGTPALVGSALLTGLKQKSERHWRGKLFVPDQKMRVTAKLELIGEQQLKVSGCALGKSLCKSQLWTRAEQPSPASN